MNLNSDLVMERLNSSDNLLNLFEDSKDPPLKSDISEIISPARSVGRPVGKSDRSLEERADIGVLSTVLGPGETSKLLGISSASGHLHAQGKVNYKDTEPNQSLMKEVKDKLSIVRDRTIKLILDTTQRVEDAELIHKISSAREAAQVMTGLASVLEKTLPKDHHDGNNVVFQIYAPSVAKESEYEVINV